MSLVVALIVKVCGYALLNIIFGVPGICPIAI
jgi:hypothetical protein